jgi:hypothetical protein
MKVFSSIKKPHKALVIAETQGDLEALKFFFSISWGFYMLWSKQQERNNIQDEKLLKVLERFPNAYGVGFLHSDQGFYHYEEIKEYKEIEKRRAMDEYQEQELNNLINLMTGDLYE